MSSETGVTALGLDTSVPSGDRAQDVAEHRAGARQSRSGALGGRRRAARAKRSRAIVARSRDGPFVFNLGHGVVPETPVAHVSQLAELRAPRSMSTHAPSCCSISAGRISSQRSSRSCSICSTIRRSSPCPRRCAGSLAQLIARRAAPIARDIYARMGGASPLARQHRGAGDGARSRARPRLPHLHRHALLAAVQRRRPRRRR